MLLRCLLATFAPLAQDAPPASTLAERIDRLAEKTNAYEHFVATYHVWSRKAGEGEMRIAYQAPNFGHYEIRGENTSLSMYVLEDSGELRCRAAEQGETTATITGFGALRQLGESAGRWVEEIFPAKSAAARSLPRAGLGFHIDLEEGCGGIAVELGQAERDRLGWLRADGQSWEFAPSSSPTARELVDSPCEGVRVYLSLETGFIARIEADTPEGIQPRLSLVSLELQERPDEGEFRAPPATAGAQDLSGQFAAMQSKLAFTLVRGSTYRALASRIDNEQLEWIEETRDKVRKLFRRVHEELVPAANEQISARIENWIERSAISLQQQLAGAKSEAREGARASVAEARERMVQQLREIGAGWPAEKRGPCPCKLRPSLDADLFALEEPILRGVFNESVAQKVLALFDEKIGKQLEAR